MDVLSESTYYGADARPHSFIEIITDGFSAANIRIAVSIFLFYLVLHSDSFCTVMEKINGAVHQKSLTSYGVFITGLLLSLFFIFVDVTIKLTK